MKNRIKKILLIDDNDITNFIHQKIIGNLKFAENILVMNDGHDALDYIKKSEDAPDLIFLDINMPTINGFDFLNKLKKFGVPANKQPKVIVLTTSFREEDRKKALNYENVVSFEVKPINPETIKKLIEKEFNLS